MRSVCAARMLREEKYNRGEKNWKRFLTFEWMMSLWWGGSPHFSEIWDLIVCIPDTEPVTQNVSSPLDENWLLLTGQSLQSSDSWLWEPSLTLWQNVFRARFVMNYWCKTLKWKLRFISCSSPDDICSPRVFLSFIVCPSWLWRLHLTCGETLNHFCIVWSSAVLHAVCSMITLQALTNWRLNYKSYGVFLSLWSCNLIFCPHDGDKHSMTSVRISDQMLDLASQNSNN